MGPAFPVEWVWIAVALALIGFLLIWRGCRIRRLGETPRCRKCDYNLTALTSDRCPECGLSLAAGAIVHGERYRRWWWAVLGVVFLALAGVSLIKPVRSINWYRFKPTFLVIRDLSSTQGPVCRKAWSELLQRDRQGKLSDRQMQGLIALCLTEQTRTPQRAISQSIFEYLARLHKRHALTEAQTRQFLQQMIQLELDVNDQVALGNDVSFTMTISKRGPSLSSGFWGACPAITCTAGGQRVAVDFGGAWGELIWAKTFSGYFPCSTPGVHTVVARAPFIIYSGKNLAPDRSEHCYEGEATANDQFEMLDDELTLKNAPGSMPESEPVQ